MLRIIRGRRTGGACPGETVVTGEIVELFVLRAGDRRTVMSEGVARGNFDHQIDAEEAAIRLAQDARRKDVPAA